MIERYSGEAEEFISEATLEFYLNGAGLKENVELAAIYERHGGLFERDTVRSVLAAAAPAPPSGGPERRRESPAERAARVLAEFAALEYLGNRLRDLTEQITNAETQAAVTWDDKPVPYRYASVVLVNEPTAERRHELERRILAVTAEQNPTRVERIRRQHAAPADLGFSSYTGMCEALSGVDLEALDAEMNRLLRETAKSYRDELAYYLDRIGVPAAEATAADGRYLLRAEPFDGMFPAERLLPALHKTLAGMGLNLADQPNIHLDVEPRPLKSPRAFCAAVRVPQEVRLVIMPKGGQDDYGSLLHETGHAQHFAHVAADRPVAFRYLGDNAITESYAFLFDHLADTPVWLADVLGVTEASDYLRLARFRRLLFLRRYAAKLHYELALHAAGRVEREADRYARLLSDALGLRVGPQNYLADVDDDYYCARYLRAWMLEVLLREQMRERAGERWFAAEEAGDFLVELWARGQEMTAEELAVELGYPGLTVEPLVQDLLAGPR
jgi:hypothetical protein